MPTLTIRSLPQTVVDELKLAALRHEVSMEEEVRGLLKRTYSGRKQWLQAAAALRKRQSRPTTAAEIDAWKRWGRE